MFLITVETYFWAAHQVKLPDGSSEKAHSHNWRVRAQMASQTLSKAQIVYDFNKIKRLMEEICAPLEAERLLENQYFKGNNPTAEMVAKYIYEQLENRLKKRNSKQRDIILESITVSEEPGCSAIVKRSSY